MGCDAEAGFVGRQHEREQRVLQNRQVSLHGIAGHAGVARQPRDVRDLSMEECRHREEAREARQVAHERLGLNLLFQVQLRVCLQRVAAVGCRPHDGQTAPMQDGIEIEVGAQLFGQERVHEALDSPSRQKVGAARLQLAGARSAEREAQAAGFHVPVHFVEQRRQLFVRLSDGMQADSSGADRRPQTGWSRLAQ